LSLSLDGKNVWLNGLFNTAPLSGKYCKKDSKKKICQPTNKKEINGVEKTHQTNYSENGMDSKEKNYRASIDTTMNTGWQSRIRSLHFQRYRKIIFQTHLNIKELTPYFSDFDNIGNYLIERHL
jgi:hypothetical protein